MAASLTPIVVSPGISAGTPFLGNASGGDVVYVKQTSPAIAVSTPLMHVNVTTNPPQIQIGPFSSALGAAQIPGATVIGSGATGTPGGNGNIVVIGTNASTVSTQDDVIIGHGANAPVAGNGGVAIGPSATSGSGVLGGGVAIGSSAVAGNGVAIGPNASCTTGNVAIGFNSTATGSGVAVGGGADAAVGAAHGNGAVAIGHNCSAGESTDIAIGTGNGGTAGSEGGNILVGSGVSGAGVTGHDCIVIGSSSNSGGAFAPAASSGNFATVIGGNSTAAHTGARIFGRGLTSTATNQTLLGGTDDPCATLVIGNGVAAASPQNVVIGPTGGSGTNVGGASLTIAGGIATGSGTGGLIVFQTSVVAASSATPQALATALTIDNTQTCTFANPFITTTTAAGAGAGTLTNLPAAATPGPPQLYMTFKTSTHTYAIPAWQIA